MVNLSKIFGEPDKGLHKLSICDIALVDTILTIIVAILIANYLYKRNCVNYIVILLKVCMCLFILSYAVHKLFNVQTRGVIKIDNFINKLIK